MSKMSELYPQYFKDVSDLTEADVYRICDLFEVGKRDPSGATHHAIKKLLLPGVRTGGKTVRDDVKEARNTLTRRLDMWDEDERIAAERQGKAHHTAISELPQPQAINCRTFKGEDISLKVAGDKMVLNLHNGEVCIGNLTDEMLAPINLEQERRNAAAKSMGELRHYQVKQAVTECGIPYMAGICPVEAEQVGNFDSDKSDCLFASTWPGDRLIDFAVRNGVRPYQVREMTPGLRNHDLYQLVDEYRMLRIK